jgi:hypothetical protein
MKERNEEMEERIPGRGNDSDPDRGLWRKLALSGEEALEAWLALMCSRIDGAVQAVVLTGGPGKGYAPAAGWSDGQGADFARFHEISEQVLEEGCGLLSPLEGGTFGLAFPVSLDGAPAGATVVEVVSSSREALTQAMQQLEWGSAWLELFLRRRAMEDAAAVNRRLGAAVELLAGVLAEEAYEGAGMAFVTELSTILDCQRISLGLVRRRAVRVRFLSHSASFGKRMNLLDAIGRAMDEALTQRTHVVLPHPQDSPLVTREHERLLADGGSASVLSVPLWQAGSYYGALTLEREKPFGEDEIEFCRTIGALVAPVLEARRREERLLAVKAAHSLWRQARRLLGPGYAGRKLAAVAVILLAVFLAGATGENRVTARAVLEGEVVRSVCAPFEGYIRDAPARAGDVVAAGAWLAVLDDRDLRLERLNWMSRTNQLRRQYEKAVAGHDRAQASIISAQVDQALSELELIERRLERTVLKAPFDGLVISGDLSQRQGGLASRGEELFTLAPLDAYRVILSVDDRRIGEVRTGQQGTLVLSAIPGERLRFSVTRITPVTTAAGGSNCFRVEAALEDAGARLRPGMEGVAKISIGRRLLADIWTRGLRDWMRLKLWSWWP